MQPKPQRINIRTENIPQELVGKPRWVGWKWVWREGENGKPGKWTKPPYDVKTGKIASSTDPSTWESFDKAYQAYKTNGYDGIGFVLNGEYTGFDFDDSRDPSNGQISEPSLSEIVRLNSYTEMSPGMEGLKTLVRAKLPKGGHHGERMGVFDIGRYFCITGHVIEGVSKRIESRQSEVDYFLKRFYPGDFGENGNGQPRTEGSGPSPKIPSDVDLIQKATKAANGAKFKKLWDGDHGDYPSQSEADFALCLILSFWTGRNAARIDSLFRQSGLMREKWDEKHYGDGRTYGQATIQKAIEETTEVYSQSQNSERTGGPSYTTSLLHYHLTDAGNAECFRELFGGQHIFIPEKKKWLRFDGIKWSEDQQVLLKMLETVRLRGKQAMSVLEDPEARKAAVKWSLASESRMRLNAALSVA
ncbi:MAG TPA: hypothetical protein VMV04_02460, partial [Thermodesulfobacteriota bacterium]|nr:hypothetical protein [Thermodesulfobacteriota bacterium]